MYLSPSLFVQVLRALRVVPWCDQAPSGRRVRLQSEDPQQRTHRGLHLQLHPGEPDPQERGLPQRQVEKQECSTINVLISYWSGNDSVTELTPNLMRSCTIHHSHKQHATVRNINPGCFISLTGRILKHLSVSPSFFFPFTKPSFLVRPGYDAHLHKGQSRNASMCCFYSFPSSVGGDHINPNVTILCTTVIRSVQINNRLPGPDITVGNQRCRYPFY